ncbi:hypothetical protein HB904_04220 [Listeria booriae]|uniref:Uncharacterized protein n=1 Tax=Listeria booriae TaxID=1552123 RepID=A0A842ABQ5_9LIST|nr:hypothetical protein [Listeria booriae]MBC1615379.1 hypothetical protein [Listeria booriae]
MEEITPKILEEKDITLTMTVAEAAMLYASVAGIKPEDYAKATSLTEMFRGASIHALSGTWGADHLRVYEELGAILAEHGAVQQSWVD